MGLFKNILMDANYCGIIGMCSSETFNILKREYKHVDFNVDAFQISGPVYESWKDGYCEFLGECKGDFNV